MTCEKCGASLREDARFCDECGAASIPPAPTNCPACGTGVGPGKRFCHSCGAALIIGPSAGGPLAPSRPTTGPNRRASLFVGIGVGLMVVAGLAFLAVSKLMAGPSPAESLTRYLNALVNDDHATARQYVTRANLQYLDTRQGGWNDEMSGALLFPFQLAPLHKIQEAGGQFSVAKEAKSIKLSGHDKNNSDPVSMEWSFYDPQAWTGDTATVRGTLSTLFRGKTAQRTADVAVVREDGHWKVSAVTFEGGNTVEGSLQRLDENLARSRIAADEASATATLRTLNTSAITFASTYGRGFVDVLKRLGIPPQGQRPSPERADLVDPTLSADGPTSTGPNNFQKNGYTFTYTPGPGAFGAITSYTITARPITYLRSGSRSFFTDQSAVMRGTGENRSATAFDAPI